MVDVVVKAQRMFFDRRTVVDAVGRANARALAKAGAYVRRRAKSSIRKRKAASRPGQPPSSHVGTLKNLIYFGYDVATQSVVVGPTPLGAVGVVPPTLEYGGQLSVRRNPRRRKRTVGQVGEVRVAGKRVVYTRLRSQAQAARANELNQQLYGPETLGERRIEPRPFMGPALAAELPRLPELWANSIPA